MITQMPWHGKGDINSATKQLQQHVLISAIEDCDLSGAAPVVAKESLAPRNFKSFPPYLWWLGLGRFPFGRSSIGTGEELGNPVGLLSRWSHQFPY
jgi:hypothetical protein